MVAGHAPGRARIFKIGYALCFKAVRFDLKKTVFILPNLFTCSSIFCGLLAMLESASNPTADGFYRAALLIVYAMFFDIIDGRVARMTKTQSAFGVQLDSLADVLSFGAAPALLVYRWSLEDLGQLGVLGAFAFLVAGTIRLARFNVLASAADGAPKAPSKYILGLPIPGAAGILVSVVVANHAVKGILPIMPWLMLVLTVVLAFFMVSTVRFRSFKDVRFSVRSATLMGLALAGTIAVALVSHVAYSLLTLLLSYVTIGVLETVISMPKRRRARKQARALEVRSDDEVLAEDADSYEAQPLETSSHS